MANVSLDHVSYRHDQLMTTPHRHTIDTASDADSAMNRCATCDAAWCILCDEEVIQTDQTGNFPLCVPCGGPDQLVGSQAELW